MNVKLCQVFSIVSEDGKKSSLLEELKKHNLIFKKVTLSGSLFYNVTMTHSKQAVNLKELCQDTTNLRTFVKIKDFGSIPSYICKPK